MSQGRDSASEVAHVARLCRRGIVCHGEMWGRLFDHLPVTGMGEFLDSLPLDVQAILREAFAVQPESFEGVIRLSAVQPAVQAAVEDWCREGPAKPLDMVED
jgi:hypothetical protein